MTIKIVPRKEQAVVNPVDVKPGHAYKDRDGALYVGIIQQPIIQNREKEQVFAVSLCGNYYIVADSTVALTPVTLIVSEE
jgi:hypothetical protein